MQSRCLVIRCMIAVTVIALLPGCQSAYYSTMEAFGQHKRDILVDRVEDARDEQEQAKEQFRSALEQFMVLVNYDGGDLRATYDRLQREYDRSEDQADDVRKRIDSIEDVADAMFREWQQELDEYTSDSLRRQSEDQLRDTRRRYDQLIDAMRRAEQRMDPVLSRFRDQVLFLKHNLNAQAIASLQGTAIDLESDIEGLILEMEAAIAEADSFIAGMSG